MTGDGIYIVLPAYNEASRIRRVIRAISECGFDQIIVVNDGSSDNTPEVAENNGATVISHAVNLGPGAATQTGIDFALKQGAHYIVTIDADGQHRAEDINTLVQYILHHDVDVVIGSRFIQAKNKIPFWRKQFNRVGNVLTYILSGLYVSDSQSGLKVMTRAFAQKLNLEHNGFEFCTEIIQKMKVHQIKYAEVPIRVRYSRDTLSKGQSFLNGLAMIYNLFKKRNM